MLLLPAAGGWVVARLVEVAGALGLFEPDPVVSSRIKRATVA